MDRRAFIAMVGGSVLAMPLATKAQQTGKVYRIGLLSSASQSAAAGVEAFREGL